MFSGGGWPGARRRVIVPFEIYKIFQDWPLSAVPHCGSVKIPIKVSYFKLLTDHLLDGR